LVVGADTGGTQVKYVVSNRNGLIVLEGMVPTNRDDAADTLARLAAVIQERLPDAQSRLGGVGIACAGIVSPRSGRLGRSPNLPGWEGLILVDLIQDAFGGSPAVIANDVNAALYGEWRWGAGRGCNDLIMIALGTGVGGGVILNGRLVTGARDGAGEIGHMVLDPNGPICTCGNRGCLEAHAGAWALIRRAREIAATEAASAAFRNLVHEGGESLDTEALYRLASRGEQTAVGLFEAAGRSLGQAVANLVNVLDPDRVIIGGGVAQAGDLILTPCRDQVQECVLAEASRQTPIVLADLGTLAAALGVATLVREREA
jgi:glucokinase